MGDRGKKLGFYCSSTSFGGLELHMVRLASWMQARGWETLLYVIGNSQMYAGKQGCINGTDAVKRAANSAEGVEDNS